jgi:hypothetical protein
MKKNVLLFTLGVLVSLGMVTLWSFKSAEKQGNTYEYKQFSTIESIIPGGAGRSRILSTDASGTLIEKDLLNFYSMVGINFSNVSNNDKLIVDKINEYSNDNWELYQVTTGSSTNVSNGSTSGGIFITRYLFRKAK